MVLFPTIAKIFLGTFGRGSFDLLQELNKTIEVINKEEKALTIKVFAKIV